MDPRRLTPRRALQAATLAAAAIAAVAPTSSSVVERWYSTAVYLRLQNVVTPLSNMAPLAWLDLLSIAGVMWIAWRWRDVLRRSSVPRLARVGAAIADTLTAGAAVYLVFLALWGLNYRREPMGARLQLERPIPTTADVLRLGEEVAARLNGLYAQAHNAGFELPAWRNPSLRRAFAEVQTELADGPPAVPGRLKRTLFGPFFRWTAVDGMVNPFGLEVLGNPDLLPFERPFVSAHEWAHLAGYADEAEANLVGWLTCVRADVASQYSGWLYLYWQIAGELPREEREALGPALREGPRGDLAAIADRLRRGDQPALRRASWRVYDTYLKANRVDEGIRSYGAVVTLILRAKFDDGFRPVRRTHRP